MALPRTPFDPANYEGTSQLGHIEKYLAQTYQQQTATLTLNRAGSFTASQVFDLGQNIAAVLVVATLTARTADGETFGTSAGNIAVLPPIPTTSPDNSHFSSDVTNWAIFTAGAIVLAAVNDSIAVSVAAAGRYLKAVCDLEIVGGADPYNGANNPTATVALTVTFT